MYESFQKRNSRTGCEPTADEFQQNRRRLEARIPSHVRFQHQPQDRRDPIFLFVAIRGGGRNGAVLDHAHSRWLGRRWHIGVRKHLWPECARWSAASRVLLVVADLARHDHDFFCTDHGPAKRFWKLFSSTTARGRRDRVSRSEHAVILDYVDGARSFAVHAVHQRWTADFRVDRLSASECSGARCRPGPCRRSESLDYFSGNFLYWRDDECAEFHRHLHR